MSLHTNSDYEIISDAEVSSAISKFSPEMISMTLDEILKYKGDNHIAPMGNMVNSYETNLRINMNKFPQAEKELLDMRIEVYNSIMDKICNAHNLSYQLPSNIDLYSATSYVYQFLVSNFYHNCITFFVNFINKECDEIYKIFDTKENTSSAHQYAVRRYDGKVSLAFIHTNLNAVIDVMNGFDISLDNIINTVYTGYQMDIASFLCSVLIDNGNFYKNFLLPAVNGLNRAEAVTNIRLSLMPNMQINNYIE